MIPDLDLAEGVDRTQGLQVGAAVQLHDETASVVEIHLVRYLPREGESARVCQDRRLQ